MAWISEDRYLTEEESLNNLRLALAKLKELGFSDESASAIGGNMYRESTVNPVLTERGGGGGYGLVQWTPKSVLTSHASTLGISPYSSGNNQCIIIQRELIIPSVNEWYTTEGFISQQNWFNGVGAEWMVGVSGAEFISNSINRTVQELTDLFVCAYERPNADPDSLRIDIRREWANVSYSILTGEDPPTPDPDPPHGGDKPIPDWNVSASIQYGALRKVIYDLFLI